ncbi:isocitrate/isopropylmalate dehydrogenase family protein [candidate division KSB1 bacterium]
MSKFKIALLPGDGIGRDVMDAAEIILDKIGLNAEYKIGDIGWEFWTSEGNPLPERTLELLTECDCALFGAITSKPKEEAEKELDLSLKNKGYVYSSPIVNLRREFDLYANIRPCRGFPGNPLNYRDDIDLVIFRENTEDLYSGVEFFPLPEELKKTLSKYSANMEKYSKTALDEIAVSCRILTKNGCRRILKSAFEYAKGNGYKSVTVVEKPNVIRETSGMMIREAREVARDYDGVELWEANVDAMAMWLIKNPNDYGVIASSNMFGDIISDLCAQLVGGLGFASSGNIGDKFAVFEPTHGSAPKYAGKNKVNPIAMILSVKLMLEFLNEKDWAKKLENAVANVIKENKVKTYDMGGNNTTIEVAKEITYFI